MKITRKQLKRLIASSMNESEKVEIDDHETRYPQSMFTPAQRMEVVRGLNSLINDAKKVDAEFRSTRDDVYQSPPKDQWNYIETLLRDVGMNVKPPRELSVHSVVDADEGEILASYLTYDEAVAYGRGLAMVPADASGRRVSTPVVDDRGNLYYVYQDQY